MYDPPPPDEDARRLKRDGAWTAARFQQRHKEKESDPLHFETLVATSRRRLAMQRKICLAIGAAIIAVGGWVAAVPAQAQSGGVKAGVLTCNVDSGWGFIFGSSRNLKCVYSPNGPSEHYSGSISKFGVDIGYMQSGVIVWTVFAPSADVGKGALAGDYGGATGSATVGVGLGANVLIGGSTKQIALQPVSFEGSTGLNVAAGIAAVSLKAEP
jgi:uncharacterized protein DUF992